LAHIPHVLLLSPFFYPESISTGRYNTFLAQSLVRLGSQVEVVASHPIFPSWKPKISRSSLEGVLIHRGGGYLLYPNSPLFRRFILELWFTFHALLFWLTSQARLTSTNHELSHLVVVPIFPPSLFFSVLSFMLPRYVRKVGIVHDLQGVYASKGSFIHRLLGRLIHAVERRSFHSCDSLVFLSTSMLSTAVQSYGLDRIRCTVSHPFVTLPKLYSSSPSVDLGLGSASYHVVYSGALGDKQEPDLLLDFLGALHAKAPYLQCHIFSAGPHLDRIRPLAIRLGVHLHDLVPSDDLPHLYSQSSVQIIPQSFGTGDGSLPSKLPNLLAAGVPVFVVCDPGSELGSLVTTFNAGVVCHDWSPDVLVDCFLASWPAFQAESHAQRKARLAPLISRTFSLQPVLDQILTSSF
jgi:colanic acid biosynthesis glycosyl transferase WcaI